MTFLILHHFPVVLLPLRLPVVTPPLCLGGLGSHPNATSRPAGATSQGSANARGGVSRGRRDTMGVLQRGDATGEEQRENDAK